MNKEITYFDFEIRAENTEEHGKVLTGHPIVFGTEAKIFHPIRGQFIEIIEKGALADTDLRDVRFLVNHNTDMIPLARSRNNNANSTMQMEVIEGKGMMIRVDLDTENNADAKALYSAVERGDISGMSFMFSIDGYKWDDKESDHPTRTVTKIGKVYEVSAVTFPAYEATSIQARGLADALDSAKASLESARAEAREIERKKHKIKLLMEV